MRGYIEFDRRHYMDWVVLHGWHKGWIRQMYRIDGVCWTLLQPQIYDAPGLIYMKYVYIWVVSKLFTTERQRSK